jgi:hypothetical protein
MLRTVPLPEASGVAPENLRSRDHIPPLAPLMTTAIRNESVPASINQTPVGFLILRAAAATNSPA